MAERTHIAAIVIVLLVQAGVAIWWIPQKWHVCQCLYDNLPAQIVCLSAHG